MRRLALLGTILLLAGCSGLGKFFGDTATLPGQNPNVASGVSENDQRSRGLQTSETPIEPQSGDIWPGPPQALPTLSDVSRNGGQTNGNMLGGSMPRGGSMSVGEHDSILNGASLDNGGFSGGAGVLSDHVVDPASKYQTKAPPGGGAGGGAGGAAGGSTGASNIVIPNGDGTSTVISPDGTVKTIKDAPK